MAVAATLDPVRILGKDMTFMVCQFAVTGSSGAVGTVKATGFGTSSIAGLRGTVVRNGTGNYTFTLPGLGSWQMIAPISCTASGDAVGASGIFESVNTTTGAITVQFYEVDDAGTVGTDQDPDDESVVTLTVLVSDFNHL